MISDIINYSVFKWKFHVFKCYLRHIPNSIFHIFSQLCFSQKRRYYNKIYIRLNSMILVQSPKTYQKWNKFTVNDELTWKLQELDIQ